MISPNVQGLLLASLLPVFAAAGCSQSNSAATFPAQNVSQQPPKVKVVTTFLPMYWFASAVAGDKAEVEILVPPGTEVHEYQATPTNVQAIAKANVLVKNGLGLEEFLEGTVKNAGNSQLKEIEASSGIVALNEDHDHKGEKAGEKDHDHAQGNPHVWLDPVLARQQVENIRDGLIAADPNNKASYQANAATYIQQLDALDKEFQQRLQPYRGCTYVTFHDAYPYIAKRYNLKQVAVVQIPEDNLSPSDVQKAVSTVKQFKVKTLLGEPGTDNKLLQGLSQDLKLTVSAIDPLENGSLDPQTYFTAMKNNLQTLETACR
jgi:zinc/manganese transport system substrate-binding protein